LASALALTALLASAALAPQPLTLLPVDLQPLARALQARGFQVRIALPPVRQAYGLYQAKTRTLWLSPLTFELGIARQTFLHEAVHAVQSCPSGVLSPIGWRFQLPVVVDREISGILTTRYHHGNRALEQEAFGMQGQADAVPRLMEALKRRCPAQARS
jgi:hypothetical protein